MWQDKRASRVVSHTMIATTTKTTETAKSTMRATTMTKNDEK
jgi:hypothetical protein